MSTGRILEITLTVKGPILSASSTATEPGLDTACHVTRDGKLAFPGTLIQGHVSESWKQIADLTSGGFTPPAGALGDKAEPTTLAPNRGALTFDEDWIGPATNGSRRVRIAIDEPRGAVAEHMMQTLAAPVAPGAHVEFSGRVRFHADDTRTAEMKAALEIGLRWRADLGALAGIGFGELLDVEVTETRDDAIPFTAGPTPDRFDLVLAFDRAVCFARRQPIGNLFVSDDVVPGAAIKAALVEALKRRASDDQKALLSHLDRLTIPHAVPVHSAATHRPGVLPLSMVHTTGQFWDVALAEPCLIGGEAPAFQPDWKSTTFEEADALRAWRPPPRDLRVHHQRDPEKRKGKDGELFSRESVLTRDQMGAFTWRCLLDVNGVPDDARLVLAKLLVGGLDKLGKTEARATVTMETPPRSRPADFSSVLTPIDGNTWVVVLETPALLCGPSLLSEGSSRDDLRNAYIAAWTDMSQGALALKRYLARQSLAGGEYLWKRYMRSSDATAPYAPYLLTETGSVFVLTSSDAGKAGDLLRKWLTTGLPLPMWARRQHGATWNRCPYIPENGYGAISVNMPIHTTRRPQPITPLARLSVKGGQQ